jgi:L-lactate dehydrogenase complex protein LldG
VRRVLGGVRRALAGADRTSPTVPREYRGIDGLDQSMGRDLVNLFAERAEDYRATIERVHPSDLEAALARLAEGLRVVVPVDLPWQVPGFEPDRGQSAAELDTFDAVVTGARLGIATTGTIVLDHAAAQGRRALSLMPDVHVCVIAAEQVISDVPHAVTMHDAHRPQTWISGPSATSDIELDRVEGVHGPRTLSVVLVDAVASPVALGRSLLNYRPAAG